MSPNQTQNAYQQAAVQSASAIELVIMLYDVLARDLTDGIAAQEAGNIESRTKALKHALLVLQQLEGSLDMNAGGELATSLARLYSMSRRQIMEAQAKQDPAILRQTLQLLQDAREAWVLVNGGSTHDATRDLRASHRTTTSAYPTEAEPSSRSTWTC